MTSRIFTAFESRNFRLMWAGACTSSIGTWMQNLAQAWLVLQLSGSPFYLGLDAFLAGTPIFALAMVAGVAADRFDRRRVLLVSQFVQMTGAFTLALFVGLGYRQIWPILMVSFIVGVAQAFGAPAYQSLIPSLVPREHLPNAIAMNSIQFNIARVIGPVIGGLALTSLGAAWCFGLNGLSFVAVIVSLLLITTDFTPGPTKETVMESMKGGITFIRQKPAMLPLIWVAFVCTFLGIPIIVFLPVFAKEVFGGTAATYTLLLSVEAAGAICGGLLVAARSKGSGVGRDAIIGLIALGVFESAFALSRSLPVALIFLFLAGMSLIACFSLLSSLVQMVATDEMRGRVMSIYNVAFRGGMPIGSLITGSLIPHFGAPIVVTIYGVILAGLAVYLLLVQRKIATL
ncbi:MFS transporter [uncultured Paludibaculum sp.]|uniref:MFS transporter n=1 Tax=uncultured Paludibaculum sp. TaxID=1765020 RepID=UPI002AAA94A8|nr:MFS transporter [uncultured Paludibaculum sp.]